jgi:hypothetical protein
MTSAPQARWYKNWFRRSTDISHVKEAARITEGIWMKAILEYEESPQVISKIKPIKEIGLCKLDEEIKASTTNASARIYLTAIKYHLIHFY